MILLNAVNIVATNLLHCVSIVKLEGLLALAVMNLVQLGLIHFIVVLRGSCFPPQA